MAHILKRKWTTWVVIDVPNLRYLYPDGALDLTKITDTGDVKDCDHGGKKLKGGAKKVGSGNDEAYVVSIAHDDDSQKFEGAFYPKGKYMVISGTVTFTTPLQIRVGDDILSQNDGIWIATHP